MSKKIKARKLMDDDDNHNGDPDEKNRSHQNQKIQQHQEQEQETTKQEKNRSHQNQKIQQHQEQEQETMKQEEVTKKQEQMTLKKQEQTMKMKPLLPSSSSNSLLVYIRRPKKSRLSATTTDILPFFDSVIEKGIDLSFETPQKPSSLVEDGTTKDQASESGAFEAESKEIPKKRKKASMQTELSQLGIDSKFAVGVSGPRRSKARNNTNLSDTKLRGFKSDQDPDRTKKWSSVSFEDVDPNVFNGLKCKVYWPLDDEWYTGSVVEYNSETYKHSVQYDDGDTENLNLSKERVKFNLSRLEMDQLNLKISQSSKEEIELDDGELLALAASFDACDSVEPGNVIWAKLAGYAVWPAVVLNEEDVGTRKDLKPIQGDRSVPVQFFGTHDFARISLKQVISFMQGVYATYHTKCKQSSFRRSLAEVKMYLSEYKLPLKMVQLQNGIESDDSESAGGKDNDSNCSGDGRTPCTKACPFEIGDLRVESLGKIVTDSEYFHNEQYIWPEGYVATRKFISITDPNVNASYKMEVIRDPDSKFRPLFRVTTDYGDQFKGSNPSACWNKIYRRIKKMQSIISNGFRADDGLKMVEESGCHMFGFSNPTVAKYIQELSSSRTPSGCKLGPKKSRGVPVGYRPVRVEWKDLDKCNVCHMDEEYVNNLFLQCDKCRMMVHARCYGELEPVNGVLWLCNLCRSGAPQSPPPCCLCPVIGGAMKPTTNGLWAHLACAIWIPETCFSDIKRMEPIDGLNRISKDRWKLLCSICGVSYGACIQCSNSTCRVAYHPLCARAAGLCVELEDEDRLHLMSFDEDEENQCIRLLSFCKKHRQPSNERSPGEHIEQVPRNCSNYIPPVNPSGCARSEPYNIQWRRGRKEPEALAAASRKRLYVENQPYLVTGYCQNGTLENASASNQLGLSYSPGFQKRIISQIETSEGVFSVAEKYNCMKETFRKRLAFGKSGIHGYGVFAKQPYRGGDMVIEYIGEIVRPSIADRREHFIYNSLVGAGTYMFRIDDERVIDATKAGSIAHLINHSCEPNCYSRVINVHGDEHIIIFSRRDINKWEELTYDYRFFSIDEQLPCYCGFPRCRGVVNDTEANVVKRLVPRSKLIDWTPTIQQID